MNEVPPSESGSLLRFLRDGESLAPPASAGLRALAAHNRLEALLYARGGLDGVDGARSAFRTRVLQAGRRLESGARLAGALAGQGIPCLALRGPFHGAWLHGDPALRPGKDIDLLVPRASARAALRVAQSLGYEHADRAMPEGFFLRHHLHWQLRHAGEGALCDLHWAVEHPYRLYRVPYADVFAAAEPQEHGGLRWLRPSPRHALLLDLLHLAKHLEPVPAPWSWDVICRQGEALRLLDCALLARRESDWPALAAEARRWNIADSIAPVLALLASDWGIPVPDDPLPAEPRPVPPVSRPVPGWLRRAAVRGGFRPDQWAAARAYCWPPLHRLGDGPAAWLAARRLLRAPVAMARIGFAAADSLVCHALASFSPAVEPAAATKPMVHTP